MSDRKKYQYVRKSIFWEGKQHWVRGKTEAEALEKLGILREKLKNGEIGISSMMRVSSWAETWLKVYVQPRVRKPGEPKKSDTMTEKNYQMYRSQIDAYILPSIGSLRIDRVRDTHLQMILNKEAGKSDSHVRKLRITLHAMFRQAYLSRLIPFDPSTDLKLPAAFRGKRRSLTADERFILLRACKIHRCGLWIKMLLYTGIRPGESAPLLVGDFDLDAGTVSITKDLESGTYAVSDPKTKSGIRTIPLPDQFAQELREAFISKNSNDFAFPQTDGIRMKSITCLSNDWESFRRCMDILAGATTQWGEHTYTIQVNGYTTTSRGKIIHSMLSPDLTAYCLRHTYCTDLQKKGVPLNIAKYLMGHKDITTTANIYTHEDEETISQANSYINSKDENT